jgi:hypothetical protein
VASEDDAIRVSDAERDDVLKILGDQAAVGRLTLDELEDRSGKALQAKTRGELAAITKDLPAESGTATVTPAPPARKPVRWMVAIMGGSNRRGRFRTAGQVNSVNIMGGDEIDLREAEIEGGHLTMNIYSLMGGSNIYVPDTVEVDLTGINIMGGNQQIGRQRPPRPGAPTIQIRAFNLMGGISVYHLPPEARGAKLSQARRLAKAAERGELSGLEPARIGLPGSPSLSRGAGRLVVDQRL